MINSTKAQAAKAKTDAQHAKARADAAATELGHLMTVASEGANAASSSSTPLDDKSGRLARARNATEHAKQANEEARELREKSLQLEDDAADLEVHLKRLLSEKAALVATCGKKEEYINRVEETL